MNPRMLVRRFPLVSYFLLAYAVSAFALVVIGLPSLAPGGHRNPLSLVMFPVMVVVVGAAGLTLTAIADGREGVRDLGSRLTRWRVHLRWYAAAILIPPAAILLVLTSLRLLVSPSFTPNLYPLGITFGLIAGFFEEIGWTGYAYPRMRSRFGPLGGAVILGLLWGIWHLPVVDSLGTASPHGPYWPAFFVSFVTAMAGLRVLIAWIYTNTGSVLLAQVMHASSTGFLVVLGALRVSPSQEVLWYALYGGVLWVTVAAIVVARRVRAGAAAPAREPDMSRVI